MTWDRERQQDEALFSIQRDFLNLNFSRQPPFNDRELVSVWIIVLDCGCWTLREQINSSAVVRIKKSRSYDGWKICSNVNLFPAGMVNNNDPEPNKGPYIKYDRNLGGRGAQRSIIFSIPHFMIGEVWGYHVNQWVITSPTTLLPGLCTSGQISLCVTSLSVSKICPDVQRPGRGVVGRVMTQWLT